MSEVLYETRGPVAHVTLNRPAARNALTYGMYERVAEICRGIAIDGPVRAVVIAGAGGRAFAAGTDIAQFRSFAQPADALAYEAKMDAVLSDIERCPVPTIAALSGACTGGGAAIAGCCDIRVADRHLRYGFPIARTLGNCLSLANLDRQSGLLGAARLREIMLTARLIEAEEALRIGLVSEVLETPEAVLERAAELAGGLAGHAPLSMRASKEGLRRLRESGPAAEGDDLVLDCYMSADFKEGVESFLAKRPAVWKAR